MKILVILVAGSLPAFAAVSYCQPIVIQHSKVPTSDQANYVLTINDTDSHLATVTHGGYAQNSNGHDIVFASDKQGQNLLTWDPLEVYDPLTGQIVTHVQVGTVSHLTDTTIYRCAGFPVSVFQGGTIGAVWPVEYLGAYHFGNGTVLSAADSSQSANNGTIVGAVAVAGKIDGAAGITGDAASITLPESMTFPFSLEAWINIGAGAANRVIAHMPGAYNDTYFSVDSSGSLLANYGGGCASTSPNAISAASWQHVAVIFSGQANACILYLNGSQVATGTMLNQSQGPATPAILGSAGTNTPLGGAMDEVRIYSGVISAPRIAVDYNNQSNPSAFYFPGTWTALQVQTGVSRVFTF